MNDQFNAQKELLVSLKHEISLLHQQVDYLIRNEKTLGLLDLDVMMNRTHTIYDRLCSINVGNAPSDEDMELDPEMLNALFGINNEEEGEPEAITEETTEPQPEEEVTEAQSEEELLEPQLEEVVTEPQPEEPIPSPEEATEPEKPVTEETEASTEDDFGFIFKMEPLEEPLTKEPQEEIQEEAQEEPREETQEEVQEEPQEELEPSMDTDTSNSLELELFPEEKKPGVYTSGDEIEMVIPHIEQVPSLEEEEPTEEEPIEEELFQEEELTEEEPFQEEEEPFEDEDAFFEEEPFEDAPVEEETPVIEEDAKEDENTFEEEVPVNEDDSFAYEPIIFGDMEEKDDLGFEFEPVETLGEKMQHADDQHTVASMLQNQSVKNLRSSIGINDKFLFVNELFGGSMEKYNRSISNLEDLKTLNGALVYLNELRIELAWNSSNEAYKKLLELIHHKFE